MGCVEYSETARVINKTVAVKAVSKRSMIMLALPCQIQFSVFAESIVGKSGNGRHPVGGSLHISVGTGALGIGSENGSYLFTHGGKELVVFFLNLFRIKIDFFGCDFRSFLGVHHSERGVCCTKCADIVFSENILKRNFLIYKHGNSTGL